jgi:hypothetical protein
MSAEEIIKQIKALPAEEQAEVTRFLQKLNVNGHNQIDAIDDVDFQKAADAVFAKHDELLRKLAS